MIDPNLIKSISYSYADGCLTFEFKTQIVIDGFNRKSAKMKCDYAKYCEIVERWQKSIKYNTN